VPNIKQRPLQERYLHAFKVNVSSGFATLNEKTSDADITRKQRLIDLNQRSPLKSTLSVTNRSGDQSVKKYEEKAAKHSNTGGSDQLVTSRTVSGTSNNAARTGAAKCQEPKHSLERDTASRHF
jgi:hypothetical protein